MSSSVVAFFMSSLKRWAADLLRCSLFAILLVTTIHKIIMDPSCSDEDDFCTEDEGVHEGAEPRSHHLRNGMN